MRKFIKNIIKDRLNNNFNNKSSRGFVLLEALICSIFVVSTFAFLSASVLPIIGTLTGKVIENDIDVVYKLYNIRKFLYNSGNHDYSGTYYNANRNKDVPTLLKCNDLGGSYSTNCNNLMISLGLRKNINGSYVDNYEMLYYNPNYSNYKQKIKELNLSDGFRDYIDSLYNKEDVNNRIICLYDKDSSSGAYLFFDKQSQYLFDNVVNLVQSSVGGFNLVDGNSKNNYVSVNGTMWRILGAETHDSSGNELNAPYMKLIIDEPINSLAFANPGAYNNDFTKTYLYRWLNEEFYNTLPSCFRDDLLNYTWDANLLDENSDIYNVVNSPKNPDSMFTAKVGLLSLYEYNQVNKKMGTSGHAYFNNSNVWYLLTPRSDTYKNSLWSISGMGTNTLGYGLESDKKGIKPVIVVNLKDVNNSNNKFILSSGNGSENKPYIVDAFEKKISNSKLNTAAIGRYVKFNNEIYRISDIYNGTTKLVAIDLAKDGNVLLKKQSAGNFNDYTTNYNSMSEATRIEYWDYYLNEIFYNSLPSNLKSLLVNGAWFYKKNNTNDYRTNVCSNINIPIYSDTNRCSYVSSVSNKKVGVSYYGEIFSANTNNDIDAWGSNYGFNLIKNTEANNGIARGELRGARISFYLSSNTTVSDGEGTFASPYIIG